ncbi:helix-turn-helix transcriptional regulator [Desulfogranum marinum]|uniref:helix-turn-helix transcriptional regulator n=1 Tax=Desulfogranum marinum TaxID=453220 RepID=UPI0019632772|nr:helix-turn-helix transcriptional regulator [Desulfogranum marinum]MBM9514188.1 helix-turn-helix transcriptional regulator [Desulfogranum marinum]
MSSVNINGSAIREFREQKELTQLYLATVVGVTTDTISRWENKRYPSIKFENAQRLAEALGVELEAILEHADSDQVEADAIRTGQQERRTEKGKTLFISQKGVFAGALFVILMVLFGGYYWMKISRQPTVAATRILPPHTAPNLSFPVIIRLKASTSVDTPILLRETITGRATATAIKTIMPSTMQEYGKNPRWIGRLVQGEAAFLYMVHPDQGMQLGELLSFAGDCVSGKVNKKGTRIVGLQSVRIEMAHWADTDKDFTLTDNEILDAYEHYSLPGNIDVDFSDLESLWLAGKYRWDEHKQTFVPDPGSRQSQGDNQ